MATFWLAVFISSHQSNCLPRYVSNFNRLMKNLHWESSMIYLTFFMMIYLNTAWVSKLGPTTAFIFQEVICKQIFICLISAAQ